jgi:CheY-like chemotaxis protein
MFDTHVPTKRVLIVDDEYVPRSLESFALEGTGRYYTFEAANATDALTALSGEQFDCDRHVDAGHVRHRAHRDDPP